jgi:hypothetical protein
MAVIIVGVCIRKETQSSGRSYFEEGERRSKAR